MNNFQNPIIIGLISCGICYAYLKWKEYHNNTHEKPSMKYPIIIGLIVFIVISLLNNHNNKKIVETHLKIPIDIISSPHPLQQYRSIGNALPHVFIETS